MKQIMITQNNRGIGIYNTFLNYDKTVKNITGYSCSVDIVYPDNTTENLPVEITDATNGEVLLVLDLSETEQKGLHKLYFNLYDANSFLTAQDMINYFVIANKGGAE